MNNLKKIIILLFCIFSFYPKTNGQSLIDHCKTIQISYNPNFENLDCPIRVCLTQELICESIGEEGNCPLTAPFTSCITLSPNHTIDSICYKVLTSSNQWCDCHLVTTEITFERLKYDSHGYLTQIEKISIQPNFIQEIMDIIESGTPVDAPIEFTKNCLGVESINAGIRLSGTGDPNQPFIILVP